MEAVDVDYERPPYPAVPETASTGPVEPEVLAYQPEAILTRRQVADWLQVGEAAVDRLPIKRLAISERQVRFLARHVLEYLEENAQ